MIGATLGVRLERRWVFFGLACLCLLMFSIDMTIVSVALRTIVEDLDTTLALAAWTMTGFTLAQTVDAAAGRQARRAVRPDAGLHRLRQLFTLGSLLCGLAPNIYVLILCRVLQALGGAGFMTSATGIVAREFPETRSRMIGLFASILPIGGIVGPNLGGFIIQQFGWREIFLVNVPIGLIAIPLLIWQSRASGLLTAPKRTSQSTARPARLRPLRRRDHLDPAGADVPRRRPGLRLHAAVLGADRERLVLLALFVWQERRALEPVIDLSLVTRHPFLVINIFNFLFGFCVFGCFPFIPYYATVQYGMWPLESGAVLTPRSLAMIVMSTCTSLFMIRLGYRLPMVLGMVGMIASMLVMGQGWDGLALGASELGPFGLLAVTVGRERRRDGPVHAVVEQRRAGSAAGPGGRGRVAAAVLPPGRRHDRHGGDRGGALVCAGQGGRAARGLHRAGAAAAGHDPAGVLDPGRGPRKRRQRSAAVEPAVAPRERAPA